MRLFVAINFNDETRSKLLALCGIEMCIFHLTNTGRELVAEKRLYADGKGGEK